MIIVYQEMREFLVEIQSKVLSITERERMTNNKNIVQLHIYAVVEMVCFMPVCHIGAFCWWKMT